ncbi:hypothetical protein RhiJN_10182 [Ceratobasidium sp. AG-Ba]|nr:hypothetical protein RhiJN_10182 [Ceratobasidium sp. AG-Ba]QRW10935.1 hypothetical protein RhiLY_09934 [Ceratobasidium sp. AG-Ba]
MTVAALLSVVLLNLGSTHAAPTPNTSSNSSATCKTVYGGNNGGTLTTNQFADANGNLVFKPYYFNKNGEVAFDSTTSDSHSEIKAVFQTCTPNYAQESNGEDDDELYGRFFIPSLNKCLAVTNPSGPAPYFLGTADCPSADDMTQRASIPFNFVADGSGGEVDMRWLGGSIPSGDIYQAGSSGCYGQLFVNATNLQHGYGFDGLGQPNTNPSEDNRVHLYCGDQKTGFNSFVIPLRGD